jgi:hypothetical protein
MLLGEMEIQHRVPDLDVTEQQLNRPEVRATLEQVRGLRMAQKMRRAAFAEPGATGRDDTGVPEDLGRDGLVGAPAVDSSGKQPRLRPHPPVIDAQRGEQRRAERHLSIASPLAALDVNQHPSAVDVGDSQLA